MLPNKQCILAIISPSRFFCFCSEYFACFWSAFPSIQNHCAQGRNTRFNMAYQQTAVTSHICSAPLSFFSWDYIRRQRFFVAQLDRLVYHSFGKVMTFTELRNFNHFNARAETRHKTQTIFFSKWYIFPIPIDTRGWYRESDTTVFKYSCFLIIHFTKTYHELNKIAFSIT